MSAEGLRVATLSFVVAAHNIEGYLDRCLESILREPGDMEVIVVDDGSTDATPAILEEVCRRDPRVQVLRNSSALGPGAARNRGLAAATGSYVWFVDGDDWLLDGAIGRLSAALACEPDVVVVDFVRAYPSGRVAPSSAADILRRAPDAPFALERWPELVAVLHVPWNKVFRRRYLDERGLAFSSSPVYEDVSFTYGALLAASRIVVLPAPCYAYRTARPGALTRTAGPTHAVWADEWHAVLTAAADAPVAVRDALFARMVWHGWSVFGMENGWRVPLALRRPFFRRFAELHGAHCRVGGPSDTVLARGWWAVAEVRVALAAISWIVQRALGRFAAFTKNR